MKRTEQLMLRVKNVCYRKMLNLEISTKYFGRCGFITSIYVTNHFDTETSIHFDNEDDETEIIKQLQLLLAEIKEIF